MILSSPFSRNNRSHQTWTNGFATSANGQHPHPHPHHHHHQHRKINTNNFDTNTTPRKPAPQQPAPQEPNGLNHLARAHTLNRLDLQNHNRRSLRASSYTPAPVATKRNLNETLFSRQVNGYQDNSQIYSPASIASPRELYGARRPLVASHHLNDSHHYAATSFRGGTPVTTASESGRSGRESVLSSLRERFGTIRKRVSKWPHKQQSTVTHQSTGDNTEPIYKTLIPIDPEIYADGKRELQAEQIYAEGLKAIDSNIEKRLLEHDLNEAVMVDGEFRAVIEEQSKRQADYLELISVLVNWINDELAHQRIIVRDLQDDLYDGQILGKLIEKLHHIHIDFVEVTQNEAAQKQKLKLVLSTINRVLSLQARWASIRWSVEGIHSKNIVEIIHLLVTLSLYYQAPLKLPQNVRVNVIVVQKIQGQLMKRSHEVQLTDSNISSRMKPDATALGCKLEKRDAFDALFEFAPDKLDLVKRSLVNFCNRHLNKINMSCSSPNSSLNDDILDPDQFSDGILLVFLVASFEDYFVPLGNLFTTATIKSANHSVEDNDLTESQLMPFISSSSNLQTAIEPTSYVNTQPLHKLHNVNIAFQLMDDAGIDIRDRIRAEDIVNGDLKSVMRLLYALFSRYKHI